MSVFGNSTLSIRKQDVLGHTVNATSSFKKITFAHKASAGDTSFSLSNLTTPPELLSSGFLQPNISVLESSNLKLLRGNLLLISSARGVLQDYLSYSVNTSNTISFTSGFGPALDGEIFIGVIDAVPRALVGIDTTSIVVTGTLPAGETEFNVGKQFKVNANPTSQTGEIAVYLDGVLQMRNVDNVPASPSADGNFHEVNAGNGYGIIIDFNVVDPINDRAVIVLSTGVTVIRPDGSLVQEMENLGGQLDAMIPTLAALAGVPESTFQSAPNNMDLKAFGTTVTSHESRISNLEEDPPVASWYESGVWSPLIEGSTTNPSGITYVTQTGTYTKIGNRVFFECTLIWSAATGGTGFCMVGGLPYIIGSDQTNVVTASYSNLDFTLNTVEGMVNGELRPGTTQIYAALVTRDNALWSNEPISIFTSGFFNKGIRLSGSYLI